jgi:hypothetical protein
VSQNRNPAQMGDFATPSLGRDGPDLCSVLNYGIDSSSRLDLRAVPLPTSVNVFMTQDTSQVAGFEVRHPKISRLKNL